MKGAATTIRLELSADELAALERCRKVLGEKTKTKTLRILIGQYQPTMQRLGEAERERDRLAKAVEAAAQAVHERDVLAADLRRYLGLEAPPPAQDEVVN